MATRPAFHEEISNLLYAAHGSPIKACIQCGTCSASCPAVEFMDHTPREIIGMIGAAFVVHGADPWMRKEFALVYAVIGLFLVINGGGDFSLDRMFHRRKR